MSSMPLFQDLRYSLEITAAHSYAFTILPPHACRGLPPPMQPTLYTAVPPPVAPAGCCWSALHGRALPFRQPNVSKLSTPLFLVVFRCRRVTRGKRFFARWKRLPRAVRSFAADDCEVPRTSISSNNHKRELSIGGSTVSQF